MYEKYRIKALINAFKGGDKKLILTFFHIFPYDFDCSKSLFTNKLLKYLTDPQNKQLAIKLLYYSAKCYLTIPNFGHSRQVAWFLLFYFFTFLIIHLDHKKIEKIPKNKKLDHYYLFFKK